MPKPAKAMQAFPSSSTHHLDNNEHSVDVLVRVKTRIETEEEEEPLRGSASPAITAPPRVAKKLFRASPSVSVSPPPLPTIISPSRARKKSPAVRSPHHEIEEQIHHLNNFPVNSRRWSSVSSHVSEDLPSPSPPPKRPRRAEDHINGGGAQSHRGNNSTGSTNLDASSQKKQNRLTPIREPVNTAGGPFQEEEYFVQDDLLQSSPRRKHNRHGSSEDRQLSRHRKQQQTIDSLQGLIDWTWPAVQQSLKDSR